VAKVILGVIGNGRKDLLAQTVAAAEDFLEYPFHQKIMINDAPSEEYNHYLWHEYGDVGWRVISHEENKGLSGSVQSLWMLAQMAGADYIFHLEEDFIINQPVAVDDMIGLLECCPYLAQVTLKRQPVNGQEAEAGGFMQLYPDHYQHGGVWTHDQRETWWVQNDMLFSLNPCVYSIDITRIGWPTGGGEREFTDKIQALRPDVMFGTLGKLNDPPLVTHIGAYRGENWFV
jgi:hypothetical protein